MLLLTLRCSAGSDAADRAAYRGLILYSMWPIHKPCIPLQFSALSMLLAVQA